MPHDRQTTLVKTLFYGVASTALYFLLYLFANPIIAMSRQGHWYFVLPIAIAFTFSLIHGNFTGQFWDLFGIKAKTSNK